MYAGLLTPLAEWRMYAKAIKMSPEPHHTDTRVTQDKTRPENYALGTK